MAAEAWIPFGPHLREDGPDQPTVELTVHWSPLRWVAVQTKDERSIAPNPFCESTVEMTVFGPSPDPLMLGAWSPK
jgi:hypothetical protein